MSDIKIFISHSSNDVSLASDLISLIRDAINIPPESIRCTSVDGFRLPAGANTNDTLKREVSESEVFVALLSQSSIKSTYVIFELGARWSSGKRLFPLLAPNLKPTQLEGPIQGLNCLSCGNSSQIHQFISELAQELNLQVNTPAIYQNKIESIISNHLSSRADVSPNYSNNHSKEPSINSVQKNKSDVGVMDIIKSKAAEDHPGDFSTQKYVISEEMSSYNTINSFSDNSIPSDVLEGIFNEAKNDHPNDFSTQLYVIKEQVSAWKSIG